MTELKADYDRSIIADLSAQTDQGAFTPHTSAADAEV